jgi:ribonuclease HI
VSDSDAKTVLYADGACRPNPGPGGYGVVLIRGGSRRELSGGFRNTTNNRMELISVIRGLRELGEPDGKVVVYSDSQYLVHMYNGGYAREWQRNGWTRDKGKQPALNADLWEELLDLCSRHEVCFIWVRGHAGNVENSRCDEMAVAARQGAALPADDGYERSASIEAPSAPDPAVRTPAEEIRDRPATAGSTRQLELF